MCGVIYELSARREVVILPRGGGAQDQAKRRPGTTTPPGIRRAKFLVNPPCSS
jgi:hypothetical protein